MIQTVDQQKLVLAIANELKGVIEMPQWANFVKTGAHRETMPRNADWWYIRAASILRYCHLKGPVGVSKLRTRYGGRKNRGMRPDKFALASGKVIRVILQQLEKAQLLKQDKVGNYKGRITSPTGAALIAKASKVVNQATPSLQPKAVKPQVEKVVEEPQAQDAPAEPVKEASKKEVKETSQKEEKATPKVEPTPTPAEKPTNKEENQNPDKQTIESAPEVQ